MKMTIDDFKLFAPRIASEDETRYALRRPFRFQRRAYVTDRCVALVLDEACDASLVTAVAAGATTAALQLDKYITAFAAANDLGRCETFGLDAALLRAAARATFADLEPSMDYLRSYEADPDAPDDVSTTESVRFVHERYSCVILPDRDRTVVAGHFADILADVLAATGARRACVRHDISSGPVYAGGENWHFMVMPLRAESTFGETGWMFAASVADAATGELLHSYYPDDDEEGRVDLYKLRFPKKGEAATRAGLQARAQFLTTKIDPFNEWDLAPVQERGWDRNRHFSAKQSQVLLERIGVDPEKIPYGQGKQLLDEYFRRLQGGYASLKQAALLKKRGFSMPLRYEQAGRMIGRMRERQGW